MKADIKEKIQSELLVRDLPSGHRDLFEKKLDKKLHQKSPDLRHILMVAASVLFLFSVGFMYNRTNQLPEVNSGSGSASQVSLEEFSPELKKIETYYLTAINVELASLEVTDGNQAILDSYLRKLSTLAEDYDQKSKQLDIHKFDEDLINALIDNLQMRLHLMIELKNELKKIKTNENEKFTV